MVNDPSAKNIACFVVDVVFAVVPFVPSGLGQVIKVGDKLKDGFGVIKKATVVGETMDRVKDFAKNIDALDDLYEGFKYYKKLAQNGPLGKALAEIGGKISNATWLFDKLRNGYTVFDIGIDTSRKARSSSYTLEEIILFLWENRNVIKALLHSQED